VKIIRSPRQASEEILADYNQTGATIDDRRVERERALIEEKETPAQEQSKGYSASLPTQQTMGKLGELFPKSEFSMWYSEMIGIAQTKNEIKQQMALCFINPVAISALYSSTFALWLYLQHGAPEEYKTEIKKIFSTLRVNTAQISDCTRTGRKIPARMYYDTLGSFELVLELMADLQAKYGLSIKLGNKKKWETTLEKFRTDPSKGISENEG
jgi:hypothetical protein